MNSRYFQWPPMILNAFQCIEKDPQICSICGPTLLYIKLEVFVFSLGVCTGHSLLTCLTWSFSLFYVSLSSLSALFTSLRRLFRSGLTFVVALFRLLVNTNFHTIIIVLLSSNSSSEYKHLYAMLKCWDATVSIPACSLAVFTAGNS